MSARLAKVESKLADAARHLNPLVIAGDVPTAHAAHEALNALAAAMLELGLAQMEHASEGTS